MKQTTPYMCSLLYLASALVLTMSVILLIFAEQTELYFSWTVNPPLTAAFLGAGYGSSFVLEFFAARRKNWAEARLAVPSVLVFTALTLIATLIHWDKFHINDPVLITNVLTWAWVMVYAIVPVLMTVILLHQIRVAGNMPSSTQPLDPRLRGAFLVQGIFMISFGIGLFLIPTIFAAFWAWQLSALTGRAVGAWLIGLGIAAVQTAWENDKQLLDFPSISYLIFGLLQLLMAFRYLSTFDWSSFSAWFYIMFLFSIVIVGAIGWQHSRLRTE
jgi:hypothetical protein